MNEKREQEIKSQPVYPLLPQLRNHLSRGHAVLSAPTGSGKTTCIPLLLRREPWLENKKILLLEPRRIGVRAAANRMSSLLGEKTGKTVGYRTRFETKISSQSEIEVITEGILIRMLQNNPELADIGLVIMDEFHERSIQTDLGLALLLDLCTLREDLRILVMSATLATDPVSRLLGNAPVLEGQGRIYPVTIEHLSPGTHQSISHTMAAGIRHALGKTTGDILAFLPGAPEIHRCRKLLAEQLHGELILPLYGDLSHREQDRIFHREDNHRRIILATPIAETGITVENISCVVDSGYFRRPVYDSRSGLSRLVTLRISRASADQRSGRAGRLGPGKCFRLWDKTEEHNMAEHTLPEILHGDLTPLVLELALWGVSDPYSLSWLDRPRQTGWRRAVRLLQKLTLLNSHARITHTGRQVAELPLHPRLGFMIISSKKHNLCWTACLLASILSERDICRGKTDSADIHERLKIVEDFASGSGSRFSIDHQLCRRILRQAKMWFKALPGRKTIDFTAIGSLLAYGFPDRIGGLRPGTSHNYLLSSGRGCRLNPADPLQGNKILVIPQVDGEKKAGRIFMAAPVLLKTLREDHPHLFHESEQTLWDDVAKQVRTTRDLILGKLQISSQPAKSPRPEKIMSVFLKAIQKTNLQCLPWSREAVNVQQRVCFLHHQTGDWPDFSNTSLAQDLAWLEPFCFGMNSFSRLKNINMKTVLLSQLSWAQQLELDTLAPTHLKVPSGSRLPISYTVPEKAVLAVRLQELFGLSETPKICGGRLPVTLHLLSPAHRPIQITDDLASFWQTTYGEVKKELSGRYPRHYWPDDPLKARATGRTKRNMNISRR
ncbi:ATP-dependent helicase HrpB [Desulfomarina sp.]